MDTWSWGTNYRHALCRSTAGREGYTNNVSLAGTKLTTYKVDWRWIDVNTKLMLVLPYINMYNSFICYLTKGNRSLSFTFWQNPCDRKNAQPSLKNFHKLKVYLFSLLAHRCIILSNELWQHSFLKEPQVIMKTFQILSLNMTKPCRLEYLLQQHYQSNCLHSDQVWNVKYLQKCYTSNYPCQQLRI